MSVRVEELASDLRRLAARDNPVHLHSIAAKLGVSEIRCLDLVEDGRLRREGRQLVIELRSDRGATRKRFTLAHELAHLMLDISSSRETVLQQRTPAARHAEEERLCDAVAAALLMPTDLVKSLHERSGMTYSLVDTLASRSRCSLSAAAARVTEVTGAQVVLAEPIGRGREGTKLMPLSRRPASLYGGVWIRCSSVSVDSKGEIDIPRGALQIGGRRGSCRIEFRTRGGRRLVFLSDLRWNPSPV